MSILPEFRERIAALPIGHPPQEVLVALSGGLDSVVLTHAMTMLGYKVTAVHINYRLRGDDSEADAHFVEQFCQQLEIPCHIETIETEKLRPKELSLQAFARNLRYEAFARIAQAEGIGFIATAHHADDQAETILLNLLRGTSIEGLAGIPAVRPLSIGAEYQIIRPLLSYRKQALIRYARENNLTWREDTSNHQTKYRRNLVRQRLMRIIQKDFGDTAIDHLVATGEDIRTYLDHDFHPKLNTLFAKATTQERTLSLTELSKLPTAWRKRLYLEAIKKWLPDFPQSRDFLGRIDSLTYAQTGAKLTLPSGAIWRDRESLVFLRLTPKTSDIFVLTPNAPCQTPWGVFELELHSTDNPEHFLKSSETDCEIWAAPPEDTPFHIRAWAIGDQFQPFGMQGRHKKVSDFLTDTKVPSTHRTNIPVLLVGDTIWAILGHRPSEAARITPTSNRIMRLRWVKATPIS